MRNKIFVLTLVVLLGGCAASPFDPIRNAPPGNPALLAVRDDINAFIGTRIRWGGTITGIENEATETKIYVASRTLDEYGRPDPTYESDGRFVARIERFVDPAVYRPGREITVAGVADGHVTQPIGNYPYVYVVVKTQEIKLWPQPPAPPYPSYPGPYFSPFYDPFWPSPWNPWW